MSRQEMIHKKRKKKRLRLLVSFAGLILLTAVILFWAFSSSHFQEEFSMDYVGAKEIPGFMQFTHYDKEGWEQKLGIEFTGALTYEKLSDLLEILEVKDYITYEEKRAGKKVDRETWNGVYVQLLDLLDTSGKVTKENLLLLNEPQKDSIETQKGIYQYDGALTSRYQAYEVYVMEDKLLGILSESEKEVALENVYVTGHKENISFLYHMNSYQIPIDTEEELADTVCDIYMKDRKIVRINKKEDVIEGKLLTLSEDRIEIEGYGSIERTEELPVYQVYGTRSEKNISDIVIGNMNISYIVAKKRVCAILLKEAPEIENVRVLLLNENQGIGREEVYVTTSAGSKMSCGENSKEYEAGTIYKASDYLKDEPNVSLKIENLEDGRLYLCDENGSKISLGYEGSFEIRKYEEGYVVVNVLSLEQYLCGVVPSEMPYNYPVEALKAQAVCARSYAGIQMLKGAYAKYGAHMDDSVNYQVYNKQEQTESTTQAVLETSGKVISYQGNIMEAYYYSTSYGHSGCYESWNLENEGNLDYLKGTWLKEDAEEIDLSDETAFAEYIQSTDEDCFDSFAKYFRWSATLDFTDKSDSIKEKINARKSVKPDSIGIYPEEKEEQETTADFGEVISVSTEGRNDCGGVEKLVVNFDNGKVEILDEYSMRVVLGCALTQITFKDGSLTNEASVLPSSYFTIISSENGIYTLCGGGYGHGIGMSQNGAKGMAEKEYTYEKILTKFYPGIELKDITELEGETS